MSLPHMIQAALEECAKYMVHSFNQSTDYKAGTSTITIEFDLNSRKFRPRAPPSARQPASRKAVATTPGEALTTPAAIPQETERATPVLKPPPPPATPTVRPLSVDPAESRGGDSQESHEDLVATAHTLRMSLKRQLNHDGDTYSIQGPLTKGQAYVEVTRKDKTKAVYQVATGTQYTAYLRDHPSIPQLNLLMLANIILANTDRPFTPSQSKWVTMTLKSNLKDTPFPPQPPDLHAAHLCLALHSASQ